MPPRNDFNDMATIIQTAMGPLMGEVQSLKGKVDGLSVDRVTRTDLEKLRTEIVGSYVPRDSYEARHAALVDRNTQLENICRELRKDHEAGVQQFREKLEDDKKQVLEQIKQQHDIQLSEKDRFWLRISQFIGFIGIAVAVLGWILQYKF